MKTFHICTVINNRKQYEQMKSSFVAAGFDDINSRYTVFDNTHGNEHEPYRTFDLISRETQEPYIIFCHQDVVMNQGHGFTDLQTVIEDMNNRHPQWAVLGNAGVCERMSRIRRLTDPYGSETNLSILPKQVISMDENFMVIKTGARLQTSPKLSGFHFYGSDICLHAMSKGYECFVVDFHLTHLSRGNYSDEFYRIRREFQQSWQKHFRFCYYQPITGTMFLSNSALLNKVFDTERLRKWFSRHPTIHLKVRRLFGESWHDGRHSPDAARNLQSQE